MLLRPGPTTAEGKAMQARDHAGPLKTFLGRGREVETFATLAEAARGGRGSIILVGREPRACETRAHFSFQVRHTQSHAAMARPKRGLTSFARRSASSSLRIPPGQSVSVPCFRKWCQGEARRGSSDRANAYSRARASSPPWSKTSRASTWRRSWYQP